MRSVLQTTAVLAVIVLAPQLSADRAEAITNKLPAGLAQGAHDMNAAQIAYVCRRHCSWRGCFRRCSQTDPIVVYRPYRRWRWW